MVTLLQTILLKVVLIILLTSEEYVEQTRNLLRIWESCTTVTTVAQTYRSLASTVAKGH